MSPTRIKPLPTSDLWTRLMRVPPFITAVACIGSVISGGTLAYWQLRMTDQEHSIRLASIDKKLDVGQVKREKDHDLLFEIAGDVKGLRLLIESMARKASFERADRP